MSNENRKEKVTIVNGKMKGTALRSAFERVWKDKGWSIETEEQAKASASPSGASANTTSSATATNKPPSN